MTEIVRETFSPSVPRPVTRSQATGFGVVMGGTAVPASVLADLAARGVAELRQVIRPGDAPPEPRYSPSTALANFVRCRDLTCSFPGCDCPVDLSDIDHTLPYDLGGPTPPSSDCSVVSSNVSDKWAGGSRRGGRGVP